MRRHLEILNNNVGAKAILRTRREELRVTMSPSRGQEEERKVEVDILRPCPEINP